MQFKLDYLVDSLVILPAGVMKWVIEMHCDYRILLNHVNQTFSNMNIKNTFYGILQEI